MGKTKKGMQYIIVGNIKEIIYNKSMRNKHVFTCEPNGKKYYTVGDKKMSVKEFEKLYPIDVKPPAVKGKNSDRTKNWLHGEKSY